MAKMTAKTVKPQAAAKIFITEQMLAQRVSGGGGAVVLAHNEFLTPAAADLAEGKHVTITRVASPMIATPAAGLDAPAQRAQPPIGAIGLVVERAGAKVASVVSSLSYDGLELADYNASGCWLENLRGLCEAVGRGAAPAGIAILPYAADAMVVANKIKGIRAVQGTRLDSVAAALRHFDANVLILEHTLSVFHEMRAMVRLFAAPRAASPGGAVCETIDTLERA